MTYNNIILVINKTFISRLILNVCDIISAVKFVWIYEYIIAIFTLLTK